jgi:hypothetical protein
MSFGLLRISNMPVTSLTVNLWDSAITFRRGTAAKVSFILLNQFDLVLTVAAVYLGFQELNPFMRYMINIPTLLIVLKIGVPLLIAWLVPGKFLVPSTTLLGLIFLWNMKELLLFLY